VGEVARARTVAEGLASALAAEPKAFGKIIEGDIALKNGDAHEAVTILNEANAILDTWLGHFDLGRAYFEAGAFAQADSEFDRCVSRRGEALSLLVDEEATYGYFPLAYYHRGRVREALNSASFADSYREYLKIRTSTEDPLLPEIRRRAGR
jgi:tetratricopeptide (TPR) repeat protein